MSISVLLRTLALVVAVGVSIVFSTLYSFHEFARSPDAAPISNACTQVTGLTAPADVQVHPPSRRAFFASAGEGERGAIYGISIDDPLDSAGWKDLTGGEPAQFAPRGLHYFDGDNVSRLFVANEATGGVELYDVDDNGRLTYLESFKDRRLKSVSDVVGYGPRQFYVSNNADATRLSGLWRLKFISRSKAGAILQFDGTSFRVAAGGLQFPSGLAIDKTNSRLIATETSGGALAVFDRDQESGQLSIEDRIAMKAGPDRVNTIQDGSILVTALSRPLAFALTPDRKTPAMQSSLILRFANPAELEDEPQRFIANDGDIVSGVKAVDRLDNTFLLGALQEDKFLICDAAEK